MVLGWVFLFVLFLFLLLFFSSVLWNTENNPALLFENKEKTGGEKKGLCYKMDVLKLWEKGGSNHSSFFLLVSHPTTIQ